MKNGLARVFTLAALAVIAAPHESAAQDQTRPAAHIYEAYYKINFADLPEWTRQFDTYAVPVLTRMRSEGLIDGWGHWQHNVGSEYNVRFAVRVFDWASIETFWSRYLGEVYGAMSESDAERAGRMVEAHYDEVWNIVSVDVRPDETWNHMYASTFNVSFADEEEWDRMWQEQVLPILEEAMDAGVLSGVVLLSHNTGPPHNKKVLYLFEEWDHMDDMWAMFFEQMEARNPEDFGRMLSMVRAHDDVIWSTPPATAN